LPDLLIAALVLVGLLDALLLLRDLPAKVRVRRLHRRNRRWVRTLPALPVRPDTAERAGTLAAAGVMVTARTPVTPAASPPAKDNQS
jgi:hypothetical protein